MITLLADISQDLAALKAVAQAAFPSTPDSLLAEWFSFDEMVKMVESGRGLVVKAETDTGEVVGMTYAQQESPINGKF